MIFGQKSQTVNINKMEKIKKLLAEYEIRFHDTDEILESSAINPEWMVNKGAYIPDIYEHKIHNQNGAVYLKDHDGERWATAKLTKKPEKWVVEKDENHPMWARFLNHYDLTDYNDRYYWMDEYSLINKAQEIIELRHQDVQYLTLDQWAEFFLPKVDFSIHNEEEWFYVKTVPPGDWSWLTKGPLTGLGSISLNLISKSFYKESGSFVNSLNEIIEFRRPTDEEMNILYEEHPEYAPYGVFGDNYAVSKTIGRLERLEPNRYCNDNGGWWTNFTPFSPELQEMLKKEIDKIK